MKLSRRDFSSVIKNAPLFSIDLVLVNESNEVLFGKRLNSPAKNFWFVPGGRVYKDESLADSFERITRDELGMVFSLDSAKPLGLYEHFYNDSAVSNDISTHYINTPYLLVVKEKFSCLPNTQHSEYRWIRADMINSADEIHSNSKLFLTKLLSKI
ncbi:MAG: GDP-mannose mannosyl hydrolase [Planctomycetes bacterium]|nr:GDP-mannose mannosyl hydrolase [Planctomycetota bacterium]